MGKCGPRRNQTKYIHHWEGFDESCSKMQLLLHLSHCVKSYRHLCQIYNDHSPNMVMSRDPGPQITKIFIFSLILYSFLGNVTIFWGELAQE